MAKEKTTGADKTRSSNKTQSDKPKSDKPKSTPRPKKELPTDPTERVDKVVADAFKSIAASGRRRFKDRFEAAKSDIANLKNTIEADIKRLGAERLRGRISEEEFGELVGDKMRLIEMAALTQAGVTMAELEKFRKAALDLLVKVVFDKLIPI